MAGPSSGRDPVQPPTRVPDMEVVIVESPAAGAELAAGAICALLNQRPDAVLGLATGSTPLPVYDALAARYAAGEVSFADTQGFALDEYVGLPQGHPESYRSVLDREIVDRVNFATGAVHTPDGWSDDPRAACAAYDAAITLAGGVDLQILGVGTDGHIGFNEPTSSLASPTRIKTLTQQTREDNARFFDGDIDQVPQHVITQGIGTILRARHLLLLAWGSNKAHAVAATVEGPVTSMVPSSALQLHPHVTVLVDEPAAEALTQADYYRHVFAHKPDWQGL